MSASLSQGGDGLLRLACALASNNQHKENDDLIKWLESASVDDLRLAFPVLLMWCRNASKKERKENKGKPITLQEALVSGGNHLDNAHPVALTTTSSIEDVEKKIVEVLEEAIVYDAEDQMALTMGDEDEDREEAEKRTNSVSSLRMSLAGYLHTNHWKLRKVPVVADLEKRIKAKIGFDRAACNTLNLVNASSPDSVSISKFSTPEDDQAAKGWGFPTISIDLGLGLQQTGPAETCKEYIRDKKPVLHPFTGETVDRMEIRKVIPSKRKPVWIEYYSKDDRHLYPDTLAKQGDDLRKDHSVASVSKLCENIWASAPIQWMTGVPTVCAYDVVVTATNAGYLEFVPGKNFMDLSKKLSPEGTSPKHGRSHSTISAGTKGTTSSRSTDGSNTGWGNVDIRKLAPSLVGSYIVNFILGVRDRHEDNMMVVGDLQENPRMMQIDFGYILMEFPGGVHYDLPRLTMPSSLVDRFNSEPGRGGIDGETPTTLMEDLQHDMLAAYLVLRRHSHQVIPFCAHLMSSMYDYKVVEAVFKGKHVFRTNQSENRVIKWMSQKLTNQWASFYFRREFKQGMVSSYYKFVEATTFNKGGSEDDAEKTPSFIAPGSLRGRITSFFAGNSKNKSNQSRNLSGSSFDDSYFGGDEEEDNKSHHSVPDVVNSSNDGEKSVFKKSRSKTSFVFDMSEMDETANKIGNTNDNKSDDAEFLNNEHLQVDMSQLNSVVCDAMKLQKEVSHQMIVTKSQTGTLKLKEFNGDGNESVNSM